MSTDSLSEIGLYGLAVRNVYPRPAFFLIEHS